jgi:glycerophosphoryl diester phosphodiesterase
MKQLLLATILTLVSLNLHALNLGHRASGGPNETFKDLPENSLTSMKKALLGNVGERALQFHEDFLYLEFDIQETYDGEIVVFHDKTLKRMIPRQGQNKSIYNDLYKSKNIRKRMGLFNLLTRKMKIKHLKLEELKRFDLGGRPGEKIPTLEEFLDAAKDYGIKKPVSVELKSIRTDKTREKLIRIMTEFNAGYMANTEIIFEANYDMPFKLGFLAFPKAFKKSLGIQWCERLIEAGLYGVFRAKKHYNFCEK